MFHAPVGWDSADQLHDDNGNFLGPAPVSQIQHDVPYDENTTEEDSEDFDLTETCIDENFQFGSSDVPCLMKDLPPVTFQAWYSASM
jgi:hypothetical protein